MYSVSLSVEVNPPGIIPILTQDQVWQGLVMKAEDAVPFVPGMESCTVLERYPDGFLREIVFRGIKMEERITFTPKVEVYFERVNTIDNAGWISNVISESNNGLILTFTFSVRFKDAPEGSEEEKLQGEKMKGTYMAAVEGTLKRIRQLFPNNVKTFTSL